MTNVSRTSFFACTTTAQAFISFGSFDEAANVWTMQVDGQVFRAATANLMIAQLHAAFKAPVVTEQMKRDRQIAANARTDRRTAELHAEQVAFHASNK